MGVGQEGEKRRVCAPKDDKGGLTSKEYDALPRKRGRSSPRRGFGGRTLRMNKGRTQDGRRKTSKGKKGEKRKKSETTARGMTRSSEE